MAVRYPAARRVSGDQETKAVHPALPKSWHPTVMQFTHLGLPVSDEQRSRQLYETYFGFDPATAERYDDGTVIIRNADGFDLALHVNADVVELPAFLHFGFRLSDADAVRTLLGRLKADGIPIVEEYDEPTYVGFKCLDPDGFHVETYCHPVSQP
jgi:catechol 2,3-dioxygenase-like lactoylglutathione lyase family enzyme